MNASTIVKKRLVYPAVTDGQLTSSNNIVFQIDVALMGCGFKLSHGLFKHIRGMDDKSALAAGLTIINAVKELVGDHVKHNVYFKQFPKNVPDTFDFWFSQIVKLFVTGTCEYGQYQHDYEEMLLFHESFQDKFGSGYKVIHLGGSLQKELRALYRDLAGSTIPLSPEDRELLSDLISNDYADESIKNVPVRENKAILNSFLLQKGKRLVVDTTTDILRMVANMSGGDVTLETNTKFISLQRKYRKNILSTLDELINKHEDKAEDVLQYVEQWKRLGEKLHPYEFPYKSAQSIFALARGEVNYHTWAGTVQQSYLDKDYRQMITLLGKKPGYLVRNVDRIIRNCSNEEFIHLTGQFSAVAGKVSGRVLLSLDEHLLNRNNSPYRTFVNKKGRAHSVENRLNRVSDDKIISLRSRIAEELIGRLKDNLSIDIRLKDFYQLAIPLSEKNKSEGFDVLPRGSVVAMSGNRRVVRLFVYWKQAAYRTDYDLSVVMYDKDFNFKRQCSWTNLRSGYTTHSGDLTDAQYGASEFIDVDTSKFPDNVAYFVPTINVYTGESFDEVEECFFGYMERDMSEWGKPFEPKTVKTKFALRGKGKICMPLAFYREGDKFFAKWTDLYIKGLSACNRVEKNHLATNQLMQGILTRKYVTLSDLLSMYELAGVNIHWTDQVTSDVVSLNNLSRLIPQ